MPNKGAGLGMGRKLGILGEENSHWWWVWWLDIKCLKELHMNTFINHGVQIQLEKK